METTEFKNENGTGTTLSCTCVSCGKTGTHTLTPKEQRTYDMYRKIGRAAGRLDQLFPDIPAWIRYGAIEPTAGTKVYCPECRR